MAFIVGFPSKDDDFENRFFFAKNSEKTVERTVLSSSRRVKPSFPKVSKKFVEAMHKELSSGNGRARVSSREQAALEAAAKTTRSSGADAPRAVVPMTLTPSATLARARTSRPLAPATSTLPLPPSLTPDELAMRRRQSEKRARLSSGKRKGIDYETSSNKQRVDTHPGVVVEREVSVSRVAAPSASGLLRDEAYAATKSKASEGNYNEMFVSEIKIKKDCDAKLAKLMSRCTKGEDEIALLKTQLSSASDLQSTRISEVVAEAKVEMACGFAGRVSKGLEPPDLPTEIKALRERRRPIYDAHNVFGDLLDSVRDVLEIPEVSATDVEMVADDDEVDEEF
ncbi:hypothetical protein AALP_AA5G135600 [Arabis alpina]|uniref:Uncharacterized protein n=1 Tax=Arabis alpina TaxID=50452 RepID=A0A087GWW0_ARAAL|nr:hypothetical protein AALP_AA5G135600 [Arabis alpina]